MIIKKACGRCNRLKALEDYNVDNSKKDGRQAYCRICSNKAVKAAAPQRKDYQRVYSAKRYKKLQDHPLRKGLTISELKYVLRLHKQN